MLPRGMLQVGFFVPGGAANSAGGAGSAFAKPAFFDPAAAQSAEQSGGVGSAADMLQGTGAGDLPGLRTGPAVDSTAEHLADTNGALHQASSAALLSAEGGTASPPPVKQVSSASAALHMTRCRSLAAQRLDIVMSCSM